MKSDSPSTSGRCSRIGAAINPLMLAMIFSLGAAAAVRAQGEIASGTISGSGSGPYTYDLMFSDAAGATSPIGSVWYAWIPGHFYLPGVPSGASAPAGWTAQVQGDSVQFVAGSTASYILPGQTLSGFSYQAAFSPTTLAAAPNSGESVAYSAGLFSDGGNTFNVQAAPEPSALTLVVLGAAGFWLRGGRKGRGAARQPSLGV